MDDKHYGTNFSTRDELREAWSRLTAPCPKHGCLTDESFCCAQCEEEALNEDFHEATYGSSLGG